MRHNTSRYSIIFKYILLIEKCTIFCKCQINTYLCLISVSNFICFYLSRVCLYVRVVYGGLLTRRAAPVRVELHVCVQLQQQAAPQQPRHGARQPRGARPAAAAGHEPQRRRQRELAQHLVQTAVSRTSKILFEINFIN